MAHTTMKETNEQAGHEAYANRAFQQATSCHVISSTCALFAGVVLTEQATRLSYFAATIRECQQLQAI
jgi:hypothetical protein